jgi:hypothetical protein
VFCNAVTLLCELGVISATFICLRNQLAWQKLLDDSGRMNSGRQLVMLILSLAATASVILLTIMGTGNILSGLTTAWRGVKKISKVAPFVTSIRTRQDRISKTGYNPEDKQFDATDVDNAHINSRIPALKTIITGTGTTH